MQQEPSELYAQIIEHVFLQKYQTGLRTLLFSRGDIEAAASELSIQLPWNIGDGLNGFFPLDMTLPEIIDRMAGEDECWILGLAGPGQYAFRLKNLGAIEIFPHLLCAMTNIPDATPNIVTRYLDNEAHSLLAKIRYNRLIDIFTDMTCYSLGNQIQAEVPDVGMVATDEIYIGVDAQGKHYIIPIQAKGDDEQLQITQIEQDIALCASMYPSLICRSIGAQLIDDNRIALFAFQFGEQGIAVISEKHYCLMVET